MSLFELQEGEKYSLILISTRSLDHTLPNEFKVSDDLWILKNLPFNIPKHWGKWLGIFQMNNIKKANLFLITKSKSNRPEIYDNENKMLMQEVFNFYLSLHLTDFFRCSGHPFEITGANLNGDIEIYKAGNESIPYFTSGTPIHNFNIEDFKKAALLKIALENLPWEKKERFNRIVFVFYDGIKNDLEYNSLHQFVRCIEGFIYPKIGETKKQFKSRTELFLGPKHHELVGELYDIRSSVEHLHSPYKIISASFGDKKLLKLTKRTFEAEVIARYCIQHFLLNRDLWTHFNNDESLGKFWKLPEDERQRIWGEQLDIDSISSQFDPRQIIIR